MTFSSSYTTGSNQAFFESHQVLLALEQVQTESSSNLCTDNPRDGTKQYVEIMLNDEETDLDKCVALAIINLQYGSHVATSVTVVRSTENGNHLLFLFQQNNAHV